MCDWLGTKHALLLGFSGLFWLQCINENANEERKNTEAERWMECLFLHVSIFLCLEL